MKDTVLGIIPARFGSVRFPGKPLAMIGNMTMIQRVYRNAAQSGKIDYLLVATDDERIKSHVISFGGNVVMTSSEHKSGTDRCAEAVTLLHDYYSIVINIQGDEPFINPQQIDQLVQCFDNEETLIATLVRQAGEEEDLNNANIIKVVLNQRGEAMYFSRSVIPFNRGSAENSDKIYYIHTGLYGYRAPVLKEIARLPCGKLELIESLEQLRWLENGYTIKAAISNYESIAVDTPQDLIKIKEKYSIVIDA